MKISKTAKNIISWTLYIALLVALVFGVPKLLAKVLDTDYPMASITSGSMWPALHKGDLVVIKGIQSKDQVQIGDIVVYKNIKGFTIHRVVKMNEDTLITRGDANNVDDAPVKYSELIGKTLTYKGKIVKIPKIGYVSLLINKPNDNAN